MAVSCTRCFGNLLLNLKTEIHGFNNLCRVFPKFRPNALLIGRNHPILISRLHFCAGSVGQTGKIDVKYHHGLVQLSVPLPSRKETCLFTLKPITNTFADFVRSLEEEDKGIDHVLAYTLDGERIAKCTPIDLILRNDFYVVINDQKYHCKSPALGIESADGLEDLSSVKNSIMHLYSVLNVEQHQLTHEQSLIKKLEQLQTEIQPFETLRKEMDAKARKRAHYLTWLGLGMMGLQFGFLARLTWWEYSWDIMEPVTYFVGYGTAMACYAYYLLTKQEYIMPLVHDREYLLSLHRHAQKSNWDAHKYNQLRDAIAQADYDLRRLRDPLQLNLPIQHLEKKPIGSGDQ